MEKGNLLSEKHKQECKFSQDDIYDYSKVLPKVTEEILEGLGKDNSPDHVGSPMIPSRSSLKEIIQLYETIIYPGYFGEKRYDRENFRYYLGNNLNQFFLLLSEQISKCMYHECTIHCVDCANVGENEALKFIKKIPGLRNLTAGDVDSAYEGDPAASSRHEIIFCYPGLKAITTYRFAHELWLQKIPLLPRMITEYAHSETGADIHPGANIGNNFFIDHATGVVIGETTVIGDKVKIYQGVTLGALSIPKDEQGNVIRTTKRHPTIEEAVVIYANATILGGKTVIGKGSVIGGSVWLTESVPPFTKLIIEPPGQKKTTVAKT